MPGRAMSRHPGTSVATSGRPHAAASNKLKGIPSRWDGNTAICAEAHSAPISSTNPRWVTLGRLLQASMSCAGIDIGFAGSGVPARSSWIWRPRWPRRACAANSVRTPFDSTRRPTNATMTGPGGSGLGVIVSISTPEPGINAIRAPFTPRPSITARSSRFCTRIAERSRFSSLRNAILNAARTRRTLTASLVNVVPSPVIALRQTMGRPVAASDPTTVAGNAT